VLVQPENLKWNIDEFEGRRKTRASFKLGKKHYDLAITDLAWKQKISHLAYGMHALAEAGLEGNEKIILTISLGEPTPFDGCCYKLVAAVLTLPA
jgi:hypothetical protein